MPRRLLALACLVVLSHPGRAAETTAPVSDDDLRIEGVFDSALPRTEPARSARLIVHPHLGDLHRSDYLRTALGLRYGLTERWEAVTEVDWFFSHGLKSSPLLERKGLSSLHIGTKYRVGRLAAGPWESSVGADFKRPVYHPPASVTDGLRHFSRTLPSRGTCPSDRTGGCSGARATISPHPPPSPASGGKTSSPTTAPTFPPASFMRTVR